MRGLTPIPVERKRKLMATCGTQVFRKQQRQQQKNYWAGVVLDACDGCGKIEELRWATWHGRKCLLCKACIRL